MRRAFGAIVLFAVIGAGLAAQDRPARFQSGVDLISVTATVVDREGRLVTGLPIEAFEIFEEGERQTITQFTNERVPVSLAVLLDVSDSMFGQRLVDARSAVEGFIYTRLAATASPGFDSPWSSHHVPRVAFIPSSSAAPSQTHARQTVAGR